MRSSPCQLHACVSSSDPRSVVLVAPTSLSAKAASFRPEIELLGETTRVLVEQIGAIDAGRLGASRLARS
jgi:mRNA interferase MazF